MDGSLLLILLGLGALLAFGDFFSSSNDDTTDRPDDDDDDDDETPDDRTRAPLVMGTQGDDLIFSGGGEVVRGWSGDDTLITDGDSTLRGGSGDDTLMSIGGGALLRGGDGEDTFVIAPVDFTEDGELLNRSGATVEPTVIVDFNPDEDRLVLDLRGSAFAPADGEPVILTGVAAPDGEGMMVQVNGVNVVQLSSYGGGGMQAALEAIDIDVIGADFEFPPAELGLPDGVEVIEDPDTGNLTFVITDDFAGGGELANVWMFGGTLDLSGFSGNAVILTDEQGIMTLEVAGTDLEPTILTEINSIILGSGENTINIGSVPGGLHVTATEGINTISGSGGLLELTLEGGTNTVSMLGGTVRALISGGENTITNVERSDITFTEDVTGTTQILHDGGFAYNRVTFLGEIPGLTVTMTPEGGAVATWENGSAEMERLMTLRVGNGATVDATAADNNSASGLSISALGPDSVVIGNENVSGIFGQGNFFAGAGNDNIALSGSLDGGGSADGGAGDDMLFVSLTEPTSGDFVLTGGDGTDTFRIAVELQNWAEVDGLVRITDLEEGERVTVLVEDFVATPEIPEIPITIVEDAEANEVRIFLNGKPLLVIENHASLPAGVLEIIDVDEEERWLDRLDG